MQTANILFPHLEKKSGGVSFWCSSAYMGMLVLIIIITWYYLVATVCEVGFLFLFLCELAKLNSYRFMLKWQYGIDS